MLDKMMNFRWCDLLKRGVLGSRWLSLVLLVMITMSVSHAQTSSEFKSHLENGTCKEFIRKYEPSHSDNAKVNKELIDIVDLMKLLCGTSRHMKVDNFKTAANSMGIYFERKNLSEFHTLLTVKINNEFIYILENLDKSNGYSFRMKGSYSVGNERGSSDFNFGLSCYEYVFVGWSPYRYKFTFEIIKSNPFCL
jgi:hypothetical protein